MELQQLPPEIIHHIISFLPSTDITTMASFYCRTIREWSLVLLNERAQQSMLQGWRLMIGATTIKTPSDGGRTEYEEDREYVCAFDYIDSTTLDMYFSVGVFGKEGFGALVDSTTTSPPPEQQEEEAKPCIPMPFGHTTTTIQVSILKEKVPTKLLEFAATLSDNYSFLVLADNYRSLEPNHDISLSANIHPEFTINYHIQRLVSADNHQDKTAAMQQGPRTDTPIIPPSPPSQSQSTATTKPDITICIDSLKIDPKWWWTRIDHHNYSNFLGLEHQYW